MKTRIINVFLIFSLIASLFLFVSNPTKTYAATIGNVDMAGDPTFDSDSIANSNSNQHRWLSYPGSRLSINPNPNNDVTVPAGPMNNLLSLNLGGWFGTATKVLNNTIQTQVAPIGGTAGSASSVNTTWSPYKISFNSQYNNPSGSGLSGYDFFYDSDSTIVRVMQVTGSAGIDLVLGGSVNGSGGAQWDGTNKVILVSDTSYYYAMQVVALSGSSLTPVQLVETPTFSGSTWSYKKTILSGEYLGVSFGIASASEGSSVAITRAKNAFSQPVATSLANTKSYMDGLLRQVPKPLVWGINSVNNSVDAFGVTPTQHKNAYYAAWTFLVSNYMKALPENSTSYNYPQVMTGKPSLWNNGHPANPGTAQWDSLMGYQMLSFIGNSTMKDIAWQSLQGLMSTVDAGGSIGGESLPARKAETAWILYKNTDNLTNLSNIYASVKNNLLWEEANPRWILPGVHDNPFEKDLLFAGSWTFDANYAIKIANALGLTSDVTLWQNKITTMQNNMRSWFFSNSPSINEYFFTDTLIKNTGKDSMIIPALGAPNLPSDMLSTLKNYFMSIHNPNRINDNFTDMKYPDANLTAYGLLDNSGQLQANQYIQATLRDAIRAGGFSEIIFDGGGVPANNGVNPGVFSAAHIVEFTWLSNNMRIDSGVPTAFTFNNSVVLAAPANFLTMENFKDVSLWPLQSNATITTSNGLATVTCLCVGLSYGHVDKSFSYNVDQYPKLTIKVNSVSSGSQWVIKVNNGSGDILLQDANSQTGDFTYDLKTLTNWSGLQNFKVILYVLNGSFTMSELSALQYEIDVFNSVANWNNPNSSNTSISTTNGIATVTLLSAPYGHNNRTVSYNVDDYPYIKIKVPQVSADGQWAFKVNDGSGDILLQAQTSATGEFAYNLKGITGWSGQKTFDLVIYIVGSSGSYVNLDYINTPVYALDNFNTSYFWSKTSLYRAASITTSGGIANIYVNSDQNQPYGSVSRTVELNVDRYRKLKINVPSLGTGAKWALKVNDGSSPDILLQGDTTQIGTYTYDLKSLTGWSGRKNFDIILFVIGTPLTYYNVNVDYLDIVDIVPTTPIIGG